MNRKAKALELRYLIALTVVGREGSFSRAAESLDYTQSAISQQIKRLEEIVDQKLVERPGGPNPVSLTTAGRILLGHGEAIMARLDSALSDLKTLSDGESGDLRIGYYQSLGNQFLPEVLREFAISCPKVTIKLTETEDDFDLLQQVERGELDIAFIVYPMVDGPFSHCELFDDPYVVVAPNDSVLGRDGASISPRELIGFPIITYARMRPVHSIEQRLGIPEISEQILLRSNNNSTILGMVRAGIGVALISHLSATPCESGLRNIPLTRVNHRVVGLAWHRDRYRTRAFNAFIDIAKQQARHFGSINSRKDNPHRTSSSL